MDNNYTNTINELYQKEERLNAVVEECQENANRALEELHTALLDLNAVKTSEKAVFVDLNAFLNRIQTQVVKADVPRIVAKKQELLGLLENVSWGVSRILDLTAEIEQELSRQND